MRVFNFDRERESISVIENSNENMFSQHTFRVKKLGPTLKSRKNYLRRYTLCEICMAFNFQINVLRQFFLIIWTIVEKQIHPDSHLL